MNQRPSHVPSMSDPITVVAYDPAWVESFRQLGARLRAALGGVALRPLPQQGLGFALATRVIRWRPARARRTRP
jgi:hypothetical protein